MKLEFISTKYAGNHVNKIDTTGHKVNILVATKQESVALLVTRIPTITHELA